MTWLATGLAASLGSRCISCRRTGPALCEGCGARAERCKVVTTVANVDRVLAPWSYEGAPRDLILALKLRARREAAGPLIDAMSRIAHANAVRAELVTWVPGRRRDTRVRGYDHAELLARGVAARLGLPAVPVIRRVSEPPDQTSLSAEARRRNLAGAFTCVADVPSTKVVIVDDLVTTGATLTACAKAIRARGGAAIEALAACRA